MVPLSDLTEAQVLALAIANEEEDGRIYRDFARHLEADYPATAKVFRDMAAEEAGHRDRLYALHRAKFGEHLTLVRRQDVTGFLKRKPLWLICNRGIERIRAEAESMEAEASAFYRQAASNARDVSIRQLLTELADEETSHQGLAHRLVETHLTPDARRSEDETAHKRFVMTYVQPGLAGLMDGSVSTLAPVFAAAFATHNNAATFLVALAAAVGAGISMGLTEALSDDGKITGRGSPIIRGWACGIMTAVGGLGHALPYLIPNGWPNAFWIATSIAVAIVLVELWAIAWIRWRYMDTPFLKAVFQIVLGGTLVLITGILLGNA
ncbi:iron exporter MbfA [Phreatobacter sp. AB_2022a]|uniref:iron exporter MbfA n=1 Tax=Phreatobacter sp. AB_2022a TaxID=3003134 RepID=UPI002286D35D|nr:ferritin family protein [Phreatobacter sp. AB_2022a]MCZ0737778.1 rubrerythrin [Phreatobacter sp. AB_2022a]